MTSKYWYRIFDADTMQHISDLGTDEESPHFYDPRIGGSGNVIWQGPYTPLEAISWRITLPDPFTNHLGLWFKNTAGEMLTSWQLLNAEKKAVAIADFRNGTLERFDAADSCIAVARDWQGQLQKAMR